MSKVKPWDFEELLDALRHALESCYRMERINKDIAVQWKGPELTSHKILATSPGIHKRLSPDSLAWSYEDQGRVAVTEILTAALQLGIEQGWRLLHDGEPDLHIIELKLRQVQERVNDRNISMMLENIITQLSSVGGVKP